MSVKLTWTPLPESKNNCQYQYYLISALVPEHLKAVYKKYKNICSISQDYAKFLLHPSKRRAKAVLKLAEASYLATRFSIMHRDGMPDEDFYFWLGYHHKITYGWNELLNQLVPFSFVYFDFRAHFWHEKKGLQAILKNLNAATRIGFVQYLKGWRSRLVVDLNNPANAYILGYVMRECPKLAKKVRIIPKNQENFEKLAQKVEENHEKTKKVKNTNDKLYATTMSQFLFKPLKPKLLERFTKEIQCGDPKYSKTN